MIFYTADDFGLTRNINEGIIECLDNNAINSVSIIVNGLAFEQAINYLKIKNIKKISIHLNLIESKPLSRIDKVSLISSKKGYLNLSFFKILLINLLLFRKKNKLIIKQIFYELLKQIKMGNLHIPRNKKTIIGIDTHYHIHAVPIIFKILLRLKEKYKIDYIRIPHESDIFKQFNIRFIKEYFFNIPKIIILNLLKKKIESKNLFFNKKCYGVIYSGNYNEIKLNKIQSLIKKDEIVEVILHPMNINNIEHKEISTLKNWKKYISTNSYYEKKNIIKAIKL